MDASLSARFRSLCCLSLFVGGSIALIIFFLWKVLVAQEQIQFRTVVQAVTQDAKSSLQISLQNNIEALIRMGKRWENGGRPLREDWQPDAEYYVRHNTGYQAIEWVNPEYIVEWIVPLEGNEAVVDLDLGKQDTRLLDMEKALQSDEILLSKNIKLVQGGTGFYVYIPLFLEGNPENFDGFLLTVFRMDRFIEEVIPRKPEQYVLNISEFPENIIYTSGDTFSQDLLPSWREHIPLEMNGITWDIEIIPTKAWFSQLRSDLPEIVLFIGLLLAGFLGLCVFYIQQFSQQSQVLLKKNKELDAIQKQLSRANEERKDSLQQTQKQNQKLKKIQKATLNILEDIEAEKANLFLEKEKTQTILQGIGDGVFVIDPNEKIILFNAMASKISGFKASEVLGKTYKKVLRFVRAGTETVENRFITTAFTEGKIQNMSRQTELIHKNGNRIPVADSCAPLKNNEEEIIGCVIVFRDVAKEREIDQMKTDFLSIASHQLRTPLGAMQWNMELVLDGDLGEVSGDMKETLQEIYENNKRLIALVNDLLNVSRIDQNRVQDNPQPTNVAQVVQAAIKELRPLAKQKNITITFENTVTLPSLQIDSKRFREVIENLLSNAVKYNIPKGQVAITCKEIKKDIQIRIEDSGIGIPKKDQPKLFRKFFRAENALHSDTEGSGLGLYVIKSYVEGWGGRVEYSGGVKKGSTFTITLPKDIKPHTLDQNLGV